MADGQVIQYDSMISSMPLDVTLSWLGKEEWAAGLQYSSTHIIGIGVRGSWCVRGKMSRGQGFVLVGFAAVEGRGIVLIGLASHELNC